MDFYWIYNYPNWQFLLMCLAFFSAFSVIGSMIFRAFFEKKLNLSERHNETVQNFLSVSGLFYGITLGLIAVGTFDTFQDAEKAVAAEAAAVNGLYRDIEMLSQPEEKAQMRKTIKSYVQYLVGEGWKLQQQGKIPKGTSKIIDTFEAQLRAYELSNDKDKIVFAEIMRQNNKLSELRRQRVNYVQIGLPSAVWHVLLIGAFITTFLTWLLVIKNNKLDIIINILCGSLLGTLIFLIAAMDNPMRGEFSVSPAPFELLLDGIMKK